MGAARAVKNVAGQGLNKLGDKIGLNPDVPAPAAPPPPPDEAAPLFKELARQATQRQLRQGKGRSAAMSSSFLGSASEPYRAPGSRTLLGG
jgi:hypothetical protein